MKKGFLFCFIVLFGVSCYSQVEMPEQMKKSLIQIRSGIFDLENQTVEQIFLNKEFISNQQLDGSISTVKYGNCNLSGNEYSLDIDFYTNDNRTASISYVFFFQGDTTLLEKIIVNNFQSGVEEESEDFTDKYQMLVFFNNLILNK